MPSKLYYQEITCLPDQEVSIGFVLGKVMDIVHIAMVNVSKNAGDPSQCPVAISFPEYRQVPGEDKRLPIGGKMRFFAQSEADLVALDLSAQLARFSDYVHITSARLLERKVRGYAIYRRRQPKSSKSRLIRRQMRRKGLSEAEATELYETFDPQQSRLPYLNIRSHSTRERFRLHIERQETEPSDSEAWSFSTYGLSSHVPVPEF